MTSQKQSIRREMRKRRRELTSKQKNIAARNLMRTGRACLRLIGARRVLAYRAFAGEISPHFLLNAMSLTSLHLPRITHFRHCLMRFYSSQHINSHNRFGILEPSMIGPPYNANRFDTVFIPVVAFDRKGTRIGMGAGYYDRALASLTHQVSTRPKLIGLAHHFQEQRDLNPEPWDIPMDAILTDREFININI